jgi:Ion channel/Pentapeptide repeats (9 copies)
MALAHHVSVLALWTSTSKVGHLLLMLNNFFKLDGTPVSHEEGTAMPNMSPDDEVTNILFRGEKWGKPRTAIKSVTFKNVSISNMELFQITFTNCTFEDCIFKGSFFHEVEFHKCKFVNCNMWKAKFEKCYLDPATIFLDSRYRVDASNVGVTMYQALLANYANERQDAFYAQADIEFRRWKRYQLSYEIRKKNVDVVPGHWRRFKNFIFDLLAGYGYKPFRFFIVTVIGFLAISAFNHCVIGNDLLINNERPPSASLINSIYYSFSVLTVLGFSTVVPDGTFAKLLTVFEALAAIGWLSIFTSILVKRLLR